MSLIQKRDVRFYFCALCLRRVPDGSPSCRNKGGLSMEICFVVSTSPKMEKLMFLKQKCNALTSKCVRIIGPTLPVWIPYRLNQNKNQMTEAYNTV